MLLGILQPEKPENFEKRLKENPNATIGITVESLYHELNALEIQSGYNHTEVVKAIKTDLMTAMGLIRLEHEGDDTNGNNPKHRDEEDTGKRR